MKPTALTNTTKHLQGLNEYNDVFMQEHNSSSSIGKIEPISPVSPVPMEADLDLVPSRLSKEELIQNMDRVDREITMVEQQICKLRKKQVSFNPSILKLFRQATLWTLK